uniref:Uncharacterized protein n=1 Tax=Eutreptiella gymnastica TaxID=73025 RepID=A0A7S4LJG8_9EUGL
MQEALVGVKQCLRQLEQQARKVVIQPPQVCAARTAAQPHVKAVRARKRAITKAIFEEVEDAQMPKRLRTAVQTRPGDLDRKGQAHPFPELLQTFRKSIDEVWGRLKNQERALAPERSPVVDGSEEGAFLRVQFATFSAVIYLTADLQAPAAAAVDVASASPSSAPGSGQDHCAQLRPALRYTGVHSVQLFGTEELQPDEVARGLPSKFLVFQKLSDQLNLQLQSQPAAILLHVPWQLRSPIPFILAQYSVHAFRDPCKACGRLLQPDPVTGTDIPPTYLHSRRGGAMDCYHEGCLQGGPEE